MTIEALPPRSDPGAHRLQAVLVLVFVVSAWYTVKLSREALVTMPDGSTMSMPAHWTVLTFSTMWSTMMLAVMLPSSWRTINTFRRVAQFRRKPHVDALALVMTLGYFAAWMVFGVTAFSAGRAFLATTIAGTLPRDTFGSTAGAGLMLAGLYQLTPWKMDCLDHCRDPLHFASLHAGPGWLDAARIGLVHGRYCVGCCAGLMFMQVLLGIMNLPVMAATTAAIAAEKLLPRPAPVAHGIGLAALTTGAVLVARTTFF